MDVCHSVQYADNSTDNSYQITDICQCDMCHIDSEMTINMCHSDDYINTEGLRYLSPKI